MKTSSLTDPYRVICFVFICIIVAVIMYSGAFNHGSNYPVPSGSQLLNGHTTISTGLSRSFSAIVRFDFAAAKDFNPHGIRIFIFFIIQLLMRIAGYFLARHPKRNMVISTDCVLSAVLFVVFFYPFLAYFSKI